MEKLGKTKATKEEIVQIDKVYDFSLEHSREAPPRATGEPYFWHIHRSAMRAVTVFILLGIFDAKLLMILILHDTIEDARKAGFDPEVVRKAIAKLFLEEIVFGTMAITKHSGERSCSMLIRLALFFYWRSHIAKAFDREDNLDTLYGVPRELQLQKLAETEKYFPAVFNRAEAEIRIAVQAKRLEKNWLKLVPLLRKRQADLIASNRERILREKQLNLFPASSGQQTIDP